MNHAACNKSALILHDPKVVNLVIIFSIIEKQEIRIVNKAIPINRRLKGVDK